MADLEKEKKTDKKIRLLHRDSCEKKGLEFEKTKKISWLSTKKYLDFGSHISFSWGFRGENTTHFGMIAHISCT